MPDRERAHDDNIENDNVEDDSADVAVGFAGALRAEGLLVPPDATVTFAAALHTIRADRPLELYWAGRSTLVRRPEDTPTFDHAFGRYFGDTSDRDHSPPADLVPGPHPDHAPTADGDPAAAERPSADDATEPSGDDEVPVDAQDSDGHDPDDATDTIERSVWSAVEILKARDLATCSPDEIDEAHRMIERLRVSAGVRRSRRRRPSSRQQGPIDLDRTIRGAIRTGGEVTRPAVTMRRTRPRRLVLLVDVSGSMEPYARSLARFAHAGVAARRRGGVEVFTLGTRITRITRELATHDPDEALRRAAASVADWSGGTRLGAGLREFNDRWGVRGVARGATVVVLSDGWDRGDPGELAAEMARLHRVAHRIVWVNPLKASPGYAPLARGMAAALPHVDAFVEGHSVLALEELAWLIAESENDHGHRRRGSRPTSADPRRTPV